MNKIGRQCALGLGAFTKSFPFLYWLTIVDAQNVAGIAELGVVFLLFLIGLGLSFNRLMTMRRLVFGLGGLQVVLTASLLSAVAAAFGQSTAVAIIVGTSLALSSTAIVLELLSDQGRLNTTGDVQVLQCSWHRTSPSFRSCCSSPCSYWEAARQ